MDFGVGFCIFGKNRTMKKLIAIMFLLACCGTPQSWSQQYPTLGEIFSFSPDDEFHFLHFYCCNDLSFQLEQLKVVDKVIGDNGLCYITQRNLFDFLTTTPPMLVDTTLFNVTDSLVIPYPDSVIFSHEDELVNDPFIYNGRDTYIHIYWILNSQKEERYTVGCGQVFNGWIVIPGSTCSVVDSLIYYIKGNEIWGSSLLAEESTPADPPLTVFPNPVRDRMYLLNEDPGLAIQEVIIMDFQGKQVDHIDAFALQQAKKTELLTDNLESGMYFLYIRTEKGIFCRKFIKF